MLRRIPAVKWAFTRLRPLPQGGSIDGAAVVAEQPVIVTEGADALPALDIGIGTNPLRSDAAVAEDGTANPVITEAAADIAGSDESLQQAPSDVEPVFVAEVLASDEVISETVDGPKPVDVPEPVIDNDPPVEVSTKLEPVATEAVAAIDIEDEPAKAAEPVISSDPSPELTTDVEPDVVEETSSNLEVASLDVVSVDVASVDAPALVVADDPSTVAAADVEPIVDDTHVTLADPDVSAEPVVEESIDSDPTSGTAVAIEPVAASDPAPVAADDSSADAIVVTHDEPAPALAAPAEEIRSAPKLRAKATEPADRTALIRQRWAESGIRMWNPRLHGTGEATLNIQGSVGLLPPAPGETMPRYDKLEFKMLGGQIVCEGVIVEAPALASHRSFARLAEPGKPERVREPTRERQAALA
ncbi:hypothetical protein SAMN05216573_118138 [Bradyrhizobium sp. Rc3b]|uniref:hypothetical protein n=1 Tax=unclassified Bradyrhizobium TaxID=2631580 RepID=UPI0008F151DC|nr:MULTISPECIES: hypothetical protein [unclassified Bradyrhizobium]MBB4377098.1 hypothetical protein [Bradyrhizobium sp. SBR1B]SFN68587.1 hypothetical protein SAMN05216573_118138 [Bradyrhizobium sp. Rc3b]